MNGKWFLNLIFTLVFSQLALCTFNTSGVETTNGVTVVVKADRIEGTTVPYADVFLFDKEYVPCVGKGIGVATVADKYGNFLFDGLGGNNFSLTVVNRSIQKSAYLSAESETQNESKELLVPGEIQGTVQTSHTGTILVFLQGTGYYCLMNTLGNFILSGVPEGIYRLKAAVLTGNGTGAQIEKQFESKEQEVQVKSGDVTNATSVLIP